MTGRDQSLRGFVVRPGDGRAIQIPGVSELTTVKAGGADTNGTISIHEGWHGADDIGVPRHYHDHLDEMFYVLEGEMRFVLDEQESVAGPGTFVYIPRGTVHAWRPVGTGPVRQLLVVVPGGFEGYFDQMQSLPPFEEDPSAWRNLGERWDVHVVGPGLAEG
jgi:mannose-6-phosphate isomerase-like protein (cupin superfamily)